jgi:hypothetical protein
VGVKQYVVNHQDYFPRAKDLVENNHPQVYNFQCSPDMKAIIVYCIYSKGEFVFEKNIYLEEHQKLANMINREY